VFWQAFGENKFGTVVSPQSRPALRRYTYPGRRKFPWPALHHAGLATGIPCSPANRQCSVKSRNIVVSRRSLPCIRPTIHYPRTFIANPPRMDSLLVMVDTSCEPAQCAPVLLQASQFERLLVFRTVGVARVLI
jgi:hypothetical protein